MSEMSEKIFPLHACFFHEKKQNTSEVFLALNPPPPCYPRPKAAENFGVFLKENRDFLLLWRIWMFFLQLPPCYLQIWNKGGGLL